MDVGGFEAELEGRLASLASTPLRGPAIANLLRFTFDRDRRAQAIRRAVQAFLIRKTIAHARSNTRWYASHDYSAEPRLGRGMEPDLTCWPVLDRSAVRENFDSLLAGDVAFESSCHTSGSTGASLTIYKSSEELAFLWEYYRALMLPSLKGLRRRPLVLTFPNVYHGSAVRLPSAGRVFVSGVTDDTLINDALRVLEKTYRIAEHDDRISIISGLSFHVKFFTSFLLERGYAPRDFRVASLTIVGEYVSQTARKFLQDAWGAMVFERFTLTESAGGADRCHRCGRLHLDPHLIGEVLDHDSGHPVEEGVGRLVLTQLYPFVQMQPLLRYDTGDIVRRLPDTCRSGSLTFEFLGKAANCVRFDVDGRTEWLLFSVDLHEVLCRIPDIRLHDTFVNVRSVRDTTVGSPPIFKQSLRRAEGAPTTLQLELELRYAPHFFADRAGEVAAQIRSALLEASESLARRVEDGSVVLAIQLFGPGTLGGTFAIKV